MEEKGTQEKDRRAEIFSALGHPLRIRILDALEEPKSEGVLSQQLNIGPALLAYHLKVLVDAGLVSKDWKDQGVVSRPLRTYSRAQLATSLLQAIEPVLAVLG
jgi:DNA-binding transcriptional ArsR family regulator